MGTLFLVCLMLILFVILLFNFFESNKKMKNLETQIETLKEKAEIPTVNMSPSEALDALQAEMDALQKKREEEEEKLRQEEETKKAKEKTIEMPPEHI